MTPSNEDVVHFNVLTNYPWEKIKRGDIVSLTFHDRDHSSVKRVIGLPGDTLYSNDGIHFYINGEYYEEAYIGDMEANFVMKNRYGDKTWVLGEDEYFALGDNRNNSNDSRSLGIINRKDIDYFVRCQWIVEEEDDNNA